MKQFFFFLLMSVMVGGFVTACASQEPKHTEATAQHKGIPPDVAQAIMDAEVAAARAASVDGEWRDTNKWIKQAKSAAKVGKYDKARKLAKKAKFEGDMGYKQAMEEKRTYDYKIKHNLPLF